MSRLDDLIQKYCPDGVEYRTAGEIFDTCTDYTAAGSFADIAKNVIYRNSPDAALLVRTMDIKNDFKSKNMVYIDNHAYEYLWRVHLDKPCIIMPNIGNCGEVYYLWPDDIPYEKAALAPNAILLNSSEVDLKYLYYVLQSKDFQKKLRKIVSPVGQTKFNKTDFKALKVPLPAMPVQREIVRILDEFTLLSAELSVELAARKKQYEYYKDMLINNQNDRKQYKLEDIATYSTDRIEASNVDENTYVGVDNLLQDKKGKKLSESVPESGKIIGYKRKDILIGNIRPYLKKIWLADNDGGTNGDVLTIRVSNNNVIIAEYLYYVLSSDVFFNYDNSHSKGAKMPRGDKKAVMQYKFALPSIKEQERIVSILDRFETLCNDISTGLPAEIEASQKQYEYYRDKLLTFKERQH